MKMAQAEIELMRLARNEQEWDSLCEHIKDKHDGEYPDGWDRHILYIRWGWTTQNDRTLKEGLWKTQRKNQNIA